MLVKNSSREGGGAPEAPPLAEELTGAGLGESLFSLRGMLDGRLFMTQWVTPHPGTYGQH